MIDEKKLIKYIAQRINTIQKKHNFNPKLGATQVAGHEKLYKDYGAFKELTDLIKSLKLNIEIPYQDQTVDIINRPRYVYFSQQVEAPDCWKIGNSFHPNKRAAQLEIGNPSDINVRYMLPGSIQDEKQRVQRYLSKYKIRGEWFKLTHEEVKWIVNHIKENGYSALENKKFEGFTHG